MTSTNTLKSNCSKQDGRIAVLILAAILFSLVLALLDTAMAYHVEELLLYTNSNLPIALAILLVAFLLQLWFRRIQKHRWLCWLLPCLAVAGLLLSELLWLGGGMARLLTYFTWGVSLPVLLGAGLAVIPPYVKAQRRAVWIGALSLVILAAVAVFAFWPRYFGDKAELAPETRLLHYTPEGEREWMTAHSEEGFYPAIRWMRVTPGIRDFDWDAERGVLLRLNGEYVLSACHNAAPAIYRYDGPLEDFAGEDLRWRVYGYPALYTELKTAATWDR